MLSCSSHLSAASSDKCSCCCASTDMCAANHAGRAQLSCSEEQNFVPALKIHHPCTNKSRDSSDSSDAMTQQHAWLPVSTGFVAVTSVVSNVLLNCREGLPASCQQLSSASLALCGLLSQSAAQHMTSPACLAAGYRQLRPSSGRRKLFPVMHTHTPCCRHSWKWQLMVSADDDS